MSIVRLCKMTLLGSTPDKREVLEALQNLGCLHVIPLAKGDAQSEAGASTHAREALRFLLSSPRKFPQVSKAPQHFDPQQVQHDALELRNRLDALTAERDDLSSRISERRPWGNFKPPRADELNGQRLWLYQVPAHERKRLEASDLRWQLMGHDHHFDYVAVISKQEPPPESMPVPPLKSDERSLGELEARLEDVELAITETQARRESLTRWSLLLARSLDHFDDQAALEHVGKQTRDVHRVFALQAWIPRQRLPQLQSLAEKRGLVLETHEPDPAETPPTQFHNPEHIAGGEELVSFYMTPSYWLKDPSPVVFFSFAFFFAMIMSDAGYGLLLSIFTIAMWKKMGGSIVARRWRIMLAWMSGLTILYGVLAGSYFGIEPRSAFLKSLHVLDTRNYGQMLLMSALIGVAHLTLANLMNAWRYGRDLKSLAPLGWAAMVVGGAAYGLASKLGIPAAKQAGIVALALGAVLVVLFTAPDQPLGKRLLGGMLGMTKVTSAFGDVLSYLRLFALGLASASLAAVFNNMAHDLYRSYAGLGLLFAILILLLGHGINFIMSISSGFIHGLRLNVIEFFNWGVQDEGKVYQPFVRKEAVPWKD